MAYYGYRARTTYAPGHRHSAPRSSGGIYYTETGEGIMSQTCSGRQQGFTAPVVECRRADSTPLFFVQSEKFPDRYYALYQRTDGSWFFSGDAKTAGGFKLEAQCVQRIKAFLASQQLAVVA